MDLSSLKPAKGSVKNKKRLGRGQGSGRGGTSTRGHKGAQSRSGYKKTRGFQGGQMPIQRTSPKFGFNNLNRIEYKGINVSTLQALAESKQLNEINLNTLFDNGLISKKDKVKILGNGDLNIKLNVKAHAFSKTAVQKIEVLGGTVENI